MSTDRFGWIPVNCFNAKVCSTYAKWCAGIIAVVVVIVDNINSIRFTCYAYFPGEMLTGHTRTELVTF